MSIDSFLLHRSDTFLTPFLCFRPADSDLVLVFRFPPPHQKLMFWLVLFESVHDSRLASSQHVQPVGAICNICFSRASILVVEVHLLITKFPSIRQRLLVLPKPNRSTCRGIPPSQSCWSIHFFHVLAIVNVEEVVIANLCCAVLFQVRFLHFSAANSRTTFVVSSLFTSVHCTNDVVGRNR